MSDIAKFKSECAEHLYPISKMAKDFQTFRTAL